MLVPRTDSDIPRQHLVRLCLLALFSCLTTVAYGQGTTPQRGFTPGGSYALTDLEAVNTVNGNLMLNVPLASLPAGRGGMSAGVSLMYNSKLWDTPPMTTLDQFGGQLQTRYPLKASLQGGWRYAFEYKLRLISRLDEQLYSAPKLTCEVDATNRNQKSTRIWKLEVIFPDGSTHELVPRGYEDGNMTDGDGYYKIHPDGSLAQCECINYAGLWECRRRNYTVNTGTMTYYSTDGTFLKLEVPHDESTAMFNKAWTLYLPNGGRVSGTGILGTYDTSSAVGPQRIYDRNDNYVEIQRTTLNSHRADKIVDQFGRSITIEYESFNQDKIHASGFGGAPLVWQVNWKTIYVRKTAYTHEHMTTHAMELNQILRVVDSVTLPAQAGGLAYDFTYNGGATDTYPDGPTTYGWGELSSITLPSGAKAEYAYKQDGVNTAHWYEVLRNHPTSKVLKYSADYDDQSTDVSETWGYSFTFHSAHSSTNMSSRTSVTGPDGGVTTDEIMSCCQNDFDIATSYRTTRPDGSVVERLWKPNYVPTLDGAIHSKNAYVDKEFTSIRDAAGNLVKTAIKDFDYDKNGNVTRVAEYDWVNYGDVERPAPSYGVVQLPTGKIPLNAQLKRATINKYYNPTPDASGTAADPDSYYNTTSKRLRSAVQSAEVWDATQMVSRTEFTYDDAATTGNLTLRRSWDSTKGPLLGTQQDSVRLGPANSISFSNEYDDNTTDPALRHGNLTLAVDANGNKTKYTYGAVTGTDGATHTGLYATAVVTAEGTSIKRTASSAYDFSTGLVTNVTDEDNQVSTSTTYDELGRPKLVREAEGETDPDNNNVSLERQTSTEYSDALRRVIVRSDLNATGDGKLVSVQHYDQLGRVRLSRTLEDSSTQLATDEHDGIKVQTRYKFSGTNSHVLVSTPHRAATSPATGGESTMGWSMTTSDQSGRAVRAETFRGKDLPAPFAVSNPNTNSTGAVVTAYDAQKVTVTDQAGKQRRSVTDALGRLVQVFEAPSAADYNFQTSYTYDAHGNLTQVAQGAQTRIFAYTSLSRLKSATNPEVCQQQQAQCVPVPVTFEYDENGNLKKKTDARGVVISYDYDALNRPTERSYVTPSGLPSTPTVTLSYDSGYTDSGGTFRQVPNAKGRLTQVSSSASTYNYNSYDALGRIKSSSQVIDNQTYGMSYGYDLAGNLTSQKYPSGRAVTTTYDSAGRLGSVNSVMPGASGNNCGKAKLCAPVLTVPTALFNNYTAHGAPASVLLGNKLTEQTDYNARLQPTQIAMINGTGEFVLKLDYTYGTVVNGVLDTTKNNGNVHSQRISVPGFDATQNYDYDQLNRLRGAREVNNAAPCKNQNGVANDCWRQSYKYDRYGNRSLDADTTFPGLPENLKDAIYNPSIDAETNRLVEDQDGNGQKDYVYDAAGNILRNAAGQTFAYDGDNMQVTLNGGASKGGAGYAYDAAGRRVKKVTPEGTTLFVYDAVGMLVAEYTTEAPQPGSGGTKFLTTDSLGSPRLVTDLNRNVVSRHDYAPFGEELLAGRTSEYQPDSVRHQFTGQERDRESGLDYFDARYYSTLQGRFTSIDPLAASGRPGDPQTWNRYSYVLNNPIRFVDDTGMIPQDASVNLRALAPKVRVSVPVSNMSEQLFTIPYAEKTMVVRSWSTMDATASKKVHEIANQIQSVYFEAQYKIHNIARRYSETGGPSSVEISGGLPITVGGTLVYGTARDQIISLQSAADVEIEPLREALANAPMFDNDARQRTFGESYAQSALTQLQDLATEAARERVRKLPAPNLPAQFQPVDPATSLIYASTPRGGPVGPVPMPYWGMNRSPEQR